ncbi:recombinase RecT [Corynebacterium kefirresidentii]|uniref:recombinase RecT n=1 Tax=Corynebacterium kefirresidentii TaxID=1979527 RepID=UPI0038D1445B
MGLNPQDPSQIALIERKTKNGKTYTLQVGIGGARRTARRIAKQEGGTYREGDWLYKGIDHSTGQETEWRDTWNVARMGYPEFAKVIVYRDGEPFPHVVTWDESKQTWGREGNLTPMWDAKPTFMLGKNAAAGAFRKAFPDELGDVYFDSESFVDTSEPIRQKATRQDVAQQALSAPAPKKKQEPEPEDDQFVRDVKAALAELTSAEAVTDFMNEIREESDVPQKVINLGRDRWNELQENK